MGVIYSELLTQAALRCSYDRGARGTPQLVIITLQAKQKDATKKRVVNQSVHHVLRAF